MKSILIIDDDKLIRKSLFSHFSNKGFQVFTAEDGMSGIREYKENVPDLVLLDIRLPDIDGLKVLRKIKEGNQQACIIIMTAYDDMKTTVEAVKSGAFEYLVKPLDYVDMDLVIDKVFKVKSLEDKMSYLVGEKQKEYTIDNIIGSTQEMREVYKLMGSVANTRANVLIQGESGTGKELVAKAIHYNSIYGNEPFIVINCSTLSDTLLETELFGHVKGAFTDAVYDTKGKFEIAGKGTLFLDEIGDVSLNLQSKLLRVLENRDYMKVGGQEVLKAEARVIAATNHKLKDLVKEGKFREDLYYRLKVVEINLPPLRERKKDIPQLAAYLLEKINRELKKNAKKVSPEVMDFLVSLPWKGNVRELENALTRAVILAKGDVILKENLPVEQNEKEMVPKKLIPLAEVEKEYIQYVLTKVKGNKSKASRILHISRPTLDKKINGYSRKT